MRTIGLLGGMSWESTLIYYRIINQGAKQHLGGLHSANIIIHSVDFEPIEACQHKGLNITARLPAKISPPMTLYWRR